jgi:hypothetical protein
MTQSPARDRTGVIYLTVAPDWRGTHDLRLIKATTGLPIVNHAEAIVVRLQLRVPAAAFRPQPIVVDVPASHVHHPEVGVEVTPISEEDTDE